MDNGVLQIGGVNGIFWFPELRRHLLEGADKFDTRIWVIAVGIVMGTLVVLGFGTCFLMYQEFRAPSGKS